MDTAESIVRIVAGVLSGASMVAGAGLLIVGGFAWRAHLRDRAEYRHPTYVTDPTEVMPRIIQDPAHAALLPARPAGRHRRPNPVARWIRHARQAGRR